MVVGIDTSVLTGWYQAKAGLAMSSSGTTGPIGQKVAPTPPWSKQPTAKEASAAVTSALAGRKLIDENAAKLDLNGASADYKKLFALYQGLGTLGDIAARMTEQGVNSGEKSRLQQVFLKGLAEVQGYVGEAEFEKLRLALGKVDTTQKSTLAVPNDPTKYVTAPLTTSTSESAPAFEGDVRFNIQVTRVNETFDVAVDLSAMPEATRSLPNVINFINGQLSAAGVETRFAMNRTPGEPKEIKAGDKTITLPAGPDQLGMKITVGTSETVSFSAPDTAGAVYMAQQVGVADPDADPETKDGTLQQQFVKFQTDTDTVGAPPQTPGQANWVDGRVFAKSLDPAVSAVRAQTVGPDGSVYMLAEVTGKVDGQAIKGQQDVALIKYDAAGNMIYTRTLGAAETASGLGLAVSADGKVAIAGSVSGALAGATEGALNSGTTGAYAGLADSFVTVFDADGQELWTQRRGSRQDDQVNQVTFGADGVVYVAGQSKTAMPGGGAAQGNWDGYIEAFGTDAAGKVSPLFTQGFGTAGADKPKGMVVDGTSLVVASVEEGRAVLRRFDLSGGAPVETASRDLGDLEGGDIAGLAIDADGRLALVGTTANPSLDVGGVTRAASGGADAFVARLDATLTGGAGDNLAYYGGSGDDRATAMTMAGGQVWIAGTSGADLPDLEAIGEKDGFLARIDADTGAVDWSRRFSGASGAAAPSAIAAAPEGASVLDRLGLPTGELTLDGTKQISAVSSVRSGDQFTISVNGRPARTVTIEANDTLDSLALKIRRASSFSAKVTIVSSQGEKQLKIEPANKTFLIEIGPGKGDFNALAELGIVEGLIRATQTDKDGKTRPADGGSNIYGLSLESSLNLLSDEQVGHARAVISAAQDVVRQAYKDLVKAATPKAQLAAEAAAKAAGEAPAYMKNQIANYQAALERLTGGGDSAGGLFGL